MAYANTEYTHTDVRPFFARPFIAFGKLMSSIAEANTLAQAANRIVEMSDEELEAKGMTRDEAIRTVFAKQGHI
jgi:hypothetical protein